MNLYVGTSGYGYKEWNGKFYPQKLPAKQMLSLFHLAGFPVGQVTNLSLGHEKQEASWKLAPHQLFHLALKRLESPIWLI